MSDEEELVSEWVEEVLLGNIPWEQWSPNDLPYELAKSLGTQSQELADTVLSEAIKWRTKQ